MFDFDEIVDRSGNHSSKWCMPYVKFSGEEERAAALKAIPMWIADMDFRTDPGITKAVIDDVAHGINGYTSRWDEMFDAFIGWIGKRHGWTIRREWLDMTPGVLSAVCTAIQVLTDPGDKIIVQTPIYTPFFELIRNNGRHVVESPLLYDGNTYSIDFDDLEKKAGDPRVRMLILCSPHNPVGRVWTAEELTRLGRICIDHDVYVFADEIHSDLILSGHKHVPFGMLSEEFAMHSITSYAPSKTFNLAGFYTSIAVIPDPVVRGRFARRMRANGANCICTPGKVALEAAYRHGEDYVTQLLAYVEGNVKLLVDFVAENLPGVHVVPPEGTYMAWIDFRNCGIPEDEINKFLLCDAGVVLEYGEWFGLAGKGFERMNLACPRATLEKALNQIKGAMDRRLGRSPTD